MADYEPTGTIGGPADYEKDPDGIQDYVFNWAQKLNGDTISTSTFLLPDGLTSVSTSNTTTTATIFVSGGSAGAMYRITNRITTAGSRTRDWTYYIKVSEQ